MAAKKNKQQRNENSLSWIPEAPGQEITGFFSGWGVMNGANGRFPVILLQGKGKDAAPHAVACNTTIARLVQESRLTWKPGKTQLQIIYNGKQGNAKIFRVLVDGKELQGAVEKPTEDDLNDLISTAAKGKGRKPGRK